MFPRPLYSGIPRETWRAVIAIAIALKCLIGGGLDHLDRDEMMMNDE